MCTMNEQTTTTTSSTKPNGQKLPKGDANPGSRAARQIRAAEFDAMKARVAELEAENQKLRNPPEELDEQSGVVNAARMRKIVAQNAIDDRGPTERTLREWLHRSPKDFFASLDDRERTERNDVDLAAENERLRKQVDDLEYSAGPDLGAERARDTIERCLMQFSDQNAGKCKTCGRGPSD